MTGLTDEQLTELVARVHRVCGGEFTSRGRPYVLGLFRSVAMVVTLMRQNLTQELAGAIFGVSQPTVSRRWDLLRPLIGQVLAECVPAAGDVVGRGTVLVDGTICPTWDWRAVGDLFSAKAGYAGMNVQIAASVDGSLVAVGATPVHGARHDAYAYTASGLAQALAGIDSVADLGYVGVEGIDTTPVAVDVEDVAGDVRGFVRRSPRRTSSRAGLAHGAGVVHRDIETAEPCDGLVDHGANVVLLTEGVVRSSRQVPVSADFHVADSPQPGWMGGPALTW